MLSLAIFGGNKVDGGSLEPGEPLIAVALFGGMDVDFGGAPAPDVDVFVVALFGGITLRVAATQRVLVHGFSLFGGRHVQPRQLPAGADHANADEDEDDDLPLEINAYAVFGGINVKRTAAPLSPAAIASER